MLEDVLRRHKFHIEENDDVIDPLMWWFAILNDPEAPVNRRDMAAAKLAEYTVAKPKPIHADGSSNSRVEVIVRNFEPLPGPATVLLGDTDDDDESPSDT